ncbi:MAG: ATP-binding cassette domain-containing protein [Treponema sp.]|jgi:simple sugar transport system ATP-binding protein|nr:ATP-binding cassette domain-containing protein [Treponema sp.]
MITLNGIEKTFPNGVKALDRADLVLNEGEIHAILGENGAGKSTLMHILAGFLRADAGNVAVDGKERRFSRYADALDAGVGMVRQHPLIAEGFPVWAVCALGAEGGFFLNPKKSRARVEAVCAKWGFSLPLDKDAVSLTVSQRQIAAVVCLLLRNCSVFVFDEVTAVLSPDETERIFALFAQLKRGGASIALISHKLDETLAIADRVTVLRKGKTIASFGRAEADAETLTESMFGKGEVEDWTGTAGGGETILSIQSLAATETGGLPLLRDVTLKVAGGSIAGVAGIKDSGIDTLELVLAGFLKRSAGVIQLNGVEVGGDPLAFRSAGGAYLAADRGGVCLAPNLSLWDNLVIHAQRKNRFFLDKGFLNDWAAGIMGKTEWARDAGARSFKETASSFSGGQLQRLILERELAETAKLLVLSEPFWGLDVQSRARLVQRLRSVTAHGGAVLIFSTDIDNIVLLCDEIFVIRDGRSVEIIRGSVESRKQRLIKSMV